MHKRLAFASLCLIFCIIPLSSSFSQEQNCEKLQSTAEQSECLSRKLQQAQTEMNLTFQHALSNYLPSAERDNETPKLPKLDLEMMHRADRRTVHSLRLSQARWLAYRDTSCGAVVADKYEGGTITAVAVPACKLELTQQRTVWLKSYFDHNYAQSNGKPSGKEPCSK